MRNAGSATYRLQELLSLEGSFWSRGLLRVAGVDEVGRGPLAGPVLAAAVVLPPDTAIPGATDSKCLSPARREALAAHILQAARAVGIGAASPREIDRINIRCATAVAMGRALKKLGLTVDHILVDGLPVDELGLDRQTAVVRGDRSIHSIACASIVAKVARDRLMARLAVRYPAYGWERNKGYPTPEHIRALRHLGPTPHHRRSFRHVDDDGPSESDC